MESGKSNHGITLVALVISIIVMIMLATVSLNMTIGENGIITQAQDAKLKQEEADIETEVMSGIASLDTEYYQKATADTGITIDSIYNMSSLAKYVNGKINGFNYNKNGTSVVYFTNTTGSYTVKFDNEGNAKTYKGIYVNKYDTIQISMDKNDTIDLATDDEDIIWIDVSNEVPLDNNNFTKNNNGTVIIKGFKNKGKDNEELVATVIIKDNGVQGNETVDTSNESKIVQTVDVGEIANTVTAYLIKNENENYTLDIKGSGALKRGAIELKVPNTTATAQPIEKLIIEEGITELNSANFMYFSAKNIYIPNTVRKIEWGTFVTNGAIDNLYYNAENAKTELFKNDTNNVSYQLLFWGGYIKNIIFGESVKNVSEFAFTFQKNLTSIVLSKNIEQIGQFAFYGCTGVKSLYLDNSLKRIGKCTFAYCSSLSSVTIPENVEYLDTFTFESCSNLKTINYNAINCEYNGIDYSNKDVNSMIRNTSLENLIISSKVKVIPKGIFVGAKIKDLVIPDSVESIKDFAFAICQELNKIEIGKNVKNIEASVFANCTSLNSITIPENVNNIGFYAFYNCTNLENVNYNAINCQYDGIESNGDGTVNLYSMFPSNVKNLKIGNNVKVIPEVILAVNSNITEINVPDSVEEVKYGAFYSDINVTKLVLGKNIKKISEKAFYNLGITEVTVPESVTYIEAEAFLGNKLTTVNYNAIKARVNCLANKVVYPIFSSNVTKIIIGPKVELLDDFLFSTTSITSITIPENVTSILATYGPFAFCKSLTEIRINKPKDSIGGAPWANDATGINVIWKE